MTCVVPAVTATANSNSGVATRLVVVLVNVLRGPFFEIPGFGRL